jgi:hypothetical protein
MAQIEIPERYIALLMTCTVHNIHVRLACVAAEMVRANAPAVHNH